jgi:hypothetical protein
MNDAFFWVISRRATAQSNAGNRSGYFTAPTIMGFAARKPWRGTLNMTGLRWHGGRTSAHAALWGLSDTKWVADYTYCYILLHSGTPC